MAVLRSLATLPAGRRTKWAVLVFWLVLVALAGPVSGRLQDVQTNDPSSFLPGSAESTRVLDLDGHFPGGDTLPAVVVYLRRPGITPADLARARADARDLRARDFVAGDVQGPTTSADGTALRLVVPIRVADGTELAHDVDAVRRATAGGGLDTTVTGPAGVQASFVEVFDTIDSTLLGSTLIVVVAILLITYRSPFLWVLPVVSAAVSLVCAQAANYLLARYAGLTINGQSAGILLILVFGAGTDYALLLVARYREELHYHTDRHRAMAEALRRAGPAIVASGVTVVLGLLCLLVAELNSTRGLGPVAAVGIGGVLLAMTTLLPALLVIVGRWVFWPLVPEVGRVGHDRYGGLWGRLARVIARRPRPVWIGTTLALGVLCVGLVTLDTGGLSNAESFRTTPEAIRGERVLADHFDVGTGTPAIIIGRAGHADALTRTARDTPGVDAVAPPVRSGPWVKVDAVLTARPDSHAAFDTVTRLRSRLHALPGAHARVGGTSAVNLDVAHAARHDNRLVIPIVLGVVLCVLGLLLRAVVAPLLLIATVVLSFAAALGASAFAFDVIFGFAGADATFPLFVFIFLVALGIDYNIFLMTRVREEACVVPTGQATARALAVTGGVITSAGVVLAATFAVLWVLPLVVMAEIGFAVAFGVLLDTLVVRSILVPALTMRIDDRIWWPSGLARCRLPRG